MNKYEHQFPMDMLGSLAALISRHGKVLLSIWLLAVILLAPYAFVSFDRMNESLEEIDPESQEGLAILKEYFDEPTFNMEKSPILVIKYDSEDGYRQLQGDPSAKLLPFTAYLKASLVEDKEWREKLDVLSGCIQTVFEKGDRDSGIIVMIIQYGEGYDLERIMEDTDHLRSKIGAVIDSYMYDLYEKSRYFDTYLTGSPAMTYDIDTDAMKSVTVSVAAAMAIILILTGLIFGSVKSAFIQFISISVSLVVALAVLGALTRFMNMPLTICLLLVMMVTVMGFIHATLILNQYGKKFRETGDPEAALGYSVFESGKVIVALTLGVFISTIVALFLSGAVIKTLMVGLAFVSLTTALVSLTVPTAFVSITKNSAFWTTNHWRNFRERVLRKKILRYRAADHKHLKLGCAFAVIMVSALAVGSAIYVVQTDEGRHVESFDAQEEFSTGESKEGLDILKEYSQAGLFQPYNILLEYDTPMAYLEVDSSILVDKWVLRWASDEAYQETLRVADLVKSSDPENISFATSLFRWDRMVEDAKAAGHTDPDEIISFIEDKTALRNVIESLALNSILALLSVEHTSEEIVLLCGPRIDYVVNVTTGSIGYEMDSEGKMAVVYSRIIANTSESATSMRSIDSTKLLNDALGRYVQSSPVLLSFQIIGTPVTYGHILADLNGSSLLTFFAIVLVVLFVVMCIFERGMLGPIVTFMPSIMGALISIAIAMLGNRLLGGNGITYLDMSYIVVVSILLGVWFGHIQDRMIIESGSVPDMMHGLYPTIVMTTMTLVAACIPLLFSQSLFLFRLGSVVIVASLVEMAFIRLLMAPSLWVLLEPVYAKRE